MFSKIVLPAIAAACVAADLPVIEVSLAGAADAFSAMEKSREQMENRFVAKLQQKVSALEKTSAPAVSRAISNVLDLHTALFQTEKDHAATHAALMQAPTALRIRVSDGASLIKAVVEHEAKLNAREEEMFRTALVSLDGAKPSASLLESTRAGDQEFAVKIGSGASMSFVDQVAKMSERRGAKLAEIRNVISGVVAELSQSPKASLVEAYPEFNVEYYTPGAAAALHGTTEADSFVAAADKIIQDQAGVMEALEKSTKAMLVESDRVTQSPMVWLNLRHGMLMESAPMGESQATVNVFEAPHSALMQSDESMDFFVESGSGALAGLNQISTKTQELLRKVSHASLVESLPDMNLHIAQGGQFAVALNEAQQATILNQRTRLMQTLKDRRNRLNELRSAISQ